MMRWLRSIVTALALVLAIGAFAPRAEAAPTCNGKFVNPITDVRRRTEDLAEQSTRSWQSGLADLRLR